MTNQLGASDQSPWATEQTYEIQFQYLDWSWDSWKWHSIVWVQTAKAEKIVQYLEWDSRRIIDGSSNIGPVEKELGDSCVNCGYHRASWEERFEMTDKWLTCLQLDRPDKYARRTLPSNDGATVMAGCICPHHIEQGTQEWYEEVIKKQKSFLEVADMGHGGWEIVSHYPDLSVVYKDWEPPKITPR